MARCQGFQLRQLLGAAGYLQQKIGKRIDTRYTPLLKFHLDLGIKHSLEVSRMLAELLPHEMPAEDLAELVPADVPTEDAPDDG